MKVRSQHGVWSCMLVATVAFCSIAGCAFGTEGPRPTPESSARKSKDSAATHALRGLNLDPRFGHACEAGHASIAQLQYLGITRVRIHPALLSGETPEEMAAQYASIVEQYRANGIAVLIVVNEETFPGAGPGRIGDWARSNPSGWSKYVDRFTAGLSQLASAVGGDVTYEIWNEPDDHWQDDGTAFGHFDGAAASKHLYPDQFAQIVTRGTNAIHHLFPSSRVIAGGVSSGKPGYVARMGAYEADGLGIHFYNIWAGSSTSQAPGGPWFNTTSYKLDEYRSVAGGRGLYLTEWGTQQIGPEGTRQLIEAFFADPASYGFEEAYMFAWCECQDAVAQSLTTDGRTAYRELWKAFRGGSGVADQPISLASRCLPDPSLSCVHDGDPGCFIAENFTCETGGNGACGGTGPTTTDCSHCCEVPAPQQPGNPGSSCLCVGTNQDGNHVETSTCDDTTCSTDGQLWICKPGSQDYQPTGDFSPCSAPPPAQPGCYCVGTNQDGNHVETSTCDDTTCSTDGQLWICKPGSQDYQPTGDFSPCSAPPPAEPECHCYGTNQDGNDVETTTCDDTTCSTDYQLWICKPGSNDYQPTGDFASCGG